MNRKFLSHLIFTFLAALFWVNLHAQPEGRLVPKGSLWEKPRYVVLILADDLGYGDLGCYGQQKITTAHLDSLAAGGMRFTQFYSSSTLCAPTRGSLLTGLHTGHAHIRDNQEMGEFVPGDEAGQFPLPEDAFTLAELFQNLGYRTGCFGKWGLGINETSGAPRLQGFDEFFGYLDQKHAHNHYPTHLWRNEEKVSLANPEIYPHQKLEGDPANLENYRKFSGKTYAMDTITGAACRFIRENAGWPFFLYFPTTLPHLALQVPDLAMQPYLGKFEETTYTGQKGYLPHPTPRAAYAGMVSVMDGHVGQIMKALEESGILENTLVIFTSDNGATYEVGGFDPAFFNSSGGLHGAKGSLFEGGIRVPFIAFWKGQIQPGKVNQTPAALWDVFPTLAELTGYSENFQTDGESLTPLFGFRPPKKTYGDRKFYWEIHSYGDGIQALRWKDWKGMRRGVHKNPAAPVELYHLKNDPAEKWDASKAFPKIAEKMARWLEAAHRPGILPVWRF